MHGGIGHTASSSQELARGRHCHTSSSSSQGSELTVCRDLATNQLNDAFAANQKLKVEHQQPRR
jgi:hypothetical protein